MAPILLNEFQTIKISQNLPVETKISQIKLQHFSTNALFKKLKLIPNNSTFDVDELMGYIILKKPLNLTTYFLQVKAQNREFSNKYSIARISIEVQNSNKYSLKFTDLKRNDNFLNNRQIFSEDLNLYSVFVAENRSLSIALVQVKAINEDSNWNGQISYYLNELETDFETDSKLFRINKTTGQVFAQKNSLDFEYKSFYKFEVLAKDDRSDLKRTHKVNLELFLEVIFFI